ncbi:NAC domain-containing protein 83-like [Olea europaea var. sylvestris]|uniref:NAC domain-containing protein 83-like n=1 Tax=Olea europaea var. sylvestris TaxID=158386 RepID=UPI000C1D3403|nr:NAC domain-containing protein 83-like [Olea europaea var. sylvestris]
MAFSLPPSFVFKPTDQKLITHYLKPKAMGFPLPGDRILERNLCGKNGTPWVVFSDNDPWEIVGDSEVGVLKKEIYVFTKLEKIGKRHFVRVAGCGTWARNSKPKDIKNCKGEVIGVKKSFTFEMNGDPKQDEVDMKKGCWIMDEYKLAGSSLEGVNNTDYANLCLARSHIVNPSAKILSYIHINPAGRRQTGPYTGHGNSGAVHAEILIFIYFLRKNYERNTYSLTYRVRIPSENFQFAQPFLHARLWHSQYHQVSFLNPPIKNSSHFT